MLLRAPLWRSEALGREGFSCHRANQLDEHDLSDWIEWQARYAAGALLMPAGRLRLVIDAYLRQRGAGSVAELSENARATLHQRVAGAFEVSAEAAGVRLAYLGANF